MENNNLEDLAVVTEVHSEHVLVQMMKSDSCHSCGLSGFCHGKEHTVTHKIAAEGNYKIGDIVKVEISAGVRIITSMLVFLVPVLTLIIFYAIAAYLLNLSEPLSILISFSGLILSGIAIYLVDKNLGKKISFEIKEKVSNENTFK